MVFLSVHTLITAYGASTGFEASEGWAAGQPPPAGSGCTLLNGYGPAPGVAAGPGGQALVLSLGAGAQFDVSLPTTGVQHVSIDLAFSSPPYATGFFRDWRGLDFGNLLLLANRTGGGGLTILFDAAAWNSAPTSYMNDGDLIMKARFFGDQPFNTPFASPGSYRFDFAFDYTRNRTTFNLFQGSGSTPVATQVWTGTFKVSAIDIYSRSWMAPEGTTTVVDNLFLGTVLSPTTVSLASSGTPAAVGAPVTFTATVNGSAPTGSVSFYDGANPLGSGTLDAAAQATLSTSSLAHGTHSITVQYSGDANNAASTSAPLTQEILARYTLTATAAPAAGGTVAGGGTFFENTTQTLTANAKAGWLFDRWTGAATGSANPLAVLVDSNKSITAGFSQDTRDSDGDGLSNYDEAVVYGTNPDSKDSDGDGFDDRFELEAGFDPQSPRSSPDTVSSIHVAVEFRFNAANGVSYRIETSTDLQSWTTLEPAILGQGGGVSRFYTAESPSTRYFRAVRN